MSNPSPISLRCVPAPFVEQASGNVLTLNKPDGSTGFTVEVSRWPFMALGQPTTLHACGQTSDGSPIMLRIADAEPLTQQEFEEGWRRTIAWDDLQDLKHNSQLMLIFQLALNNAGCDCPLLFPPISLKVRVPFEDLTTFSDAEEAPWNGWTKGPAAIDPGDLVVAKDEDIYVLNNRTYTNASAGIILEKNFANLEAGTRYEFGLQVRRTNTSSSVPSLSLAAGTQTVTEAKDFPAMTWESLEGTFTADSSQCTLAIISHTASGSGNDYAIKRICVRSV